MTQQNELEQQMEEATPKFMEAALALRVAALYPKLAEADVPKVAKIIHEDMRRDVDSGDLMENLAPYKLGPAEKVAKVVDNMQGDAANALVGLGTDILEDGAEHEVLWTTAR